MQLLERLKIDDIKIIKSNSSIWKRTTRRMTLYRCKEFDQWSLQIRVYDIFTIHLHCNSLKYIGDDLSSVKSSWRTWVATNDIRMITVKRQLTEKYQIRWVYRYSNLNTVVLPKFCFNECAYRLRWSRNFRNQICNILSQKNIVIVLICKRWWWAYHNS